MPFACILVHSFCLSSSPISCLNCTYPTCRCIYVVRKFNLCVSILCTQMRSMTMWHRLRDPSLNSCGWCQHNQNAGATHKTSCCSVWQGHVRAQSCMKCCTTVQAFFYPMPKLARGLYQLSHSEMVSTTCHRNILQCDSLNCLMTTKCFTWALTKSTPPGGLSWRLLRRDGGRNHEDIALYSFGVNRRKLQRYGYHGADKSSNSKCWQNLPCSAWTPL